MKLRLAGVLLCAASPMALAPAMAQDTAAPVTAPADPAAVPADPAAAPVAAPTNSSATHMLAGTEVRMLTRTPLSSKTNHSGDRFELEVTDDVVANGMVMIPRGARATGEISRVRKKGMWGRSGILETRLVSVQVGDREIRLRGAAGDRGRSGTAAAVGAVLLSPLIVAPFVGFFITGTSATVPAMTLSVGVTEEDVPLELAVGPASAGQPASPVGAVPTDGLADPANAPADPVPEAAPPPSQGR